MARSEIAQANERLAVIETKVTLLSDSAVGMANNAQYIRDLERRMTRLETLVGKD